MLDAVVDCNVLVSSLLGTSCRPILDAFLDRKFQLVTSKDLFAELKLVLNRSHISSRVPKSLRGRFLNQIKKLAVFVDSPTIVCACRDADDDALLGCALTHGRLIVTFDPDLLCMNPFRDVSIITPQEFMKRVR